MTDGVGTAASGSSGPDGLDLSADQVGWWVATVTAARAALAMIPTSEDLRDRQALLVRELDRVVEHGSPAVRAAATAAPADLLVELTLAGLREPASARPYDAERSGVLRRRVLQALVGVADDVAEVAVRATVREAWVVADILAAGRLARTLLDEDPVGSPS